MLLYSLILIAFVQFISVDQPIEAGGVSGYWTGEITQEESDYRYAAKYQLEMMLIEKNGVVTGKSYVKVDNIFAEMEMSGSFTNDIVLTVKDLGINRSRVETGMEWCLKSYILLLKKEDKEWILEGHWQGSTSFSTCTPGKVKLKKGVHRA